MGGARAAGGDDDDGWEVVFSSFRRFACGAYLSRRQILELLGEDVRRGQDATSRLAF